MTATRHRGFTLIEVLLATVLLSVMMLLLTGSLRIGAESWEAGEKRLADASRLFVVENFLRHHIGSLLPVAGTVVSGEMRPAFYGSSDTLSYVAPMPEQIDVGGLYRFDVYWAKADDNRRDLRVSITPYNAAPSDTKPPEPVDDLSIVEDVEKFTVSYFPQPPPATNPNGINPLQPDPQWLDEWRDPQLPALIRITITPAGEKTWPELLIAPKTRILR